MGDVYQNELFPGAKTAEIEWECVELSMRWMYQEYGIKPYGVGGGKGVVWQYSGSTLIHVINDGHSGQETYSYGNTNVPSYGSRGIAPAPGDIVSFTQIAPGGHTGVVVSASVDSNGNGTVVMVDQNDGTTFRNIPMTSWVLQDNLTATGWLHDPNTTREDIITRDANGQLHQFWYRVNDQCLSSGCSLTWNSLPSGLVRFVSDPATVWWMADSRFDLYAEGDDGHGNWQLWQYWWYVNGASGWQSLGSYPAGSIGSDTPAVAAQATGNRIDIFVIRGGQLYWKHWSDAGSEPPDCISSSCGWDPTRTAPVSLMSHPAAVWFNQGTTPTLEVYAEGSDYQDYAIWYQNGSWSSSWTVLGPYPSSSHFVAGPGAAARSDGRIDEYVTDNNGFEDFKYYNGCWLNCWYYLGQQANQPTQAASDPAVGWWAFNGLYRIDIYYQDVNGHLAGRWWMSDGTASWVDFGAWPGGSAAGNAPALAVSR